MQPLTHKFMILRLLTHKYLTLPIKRCFYVYIKCLVLHKDLKDRIFLKKVLFKNLKNFSALSNTEEKVSTHEIDHAIDEFDDYEEDESDDINFDHKEESRD
ncbi:hypothetical protein DMUE_0423 [Dictyocoela muelleri]|nr:hypothetical protein DMUE_0423 [Dictyocoela muelleri]